MNVPPFRWLRARFDLAHDLAEPAEIVADVKAGIAFKGRHQPVGVVLCHSGGLGKVERQFDGPHEAMFISPLMGPIVGVDFGAAISNVDLVRRGLKSRGAVLVFCINAACSAAVTSG